MKKLVIATAAFSLLSTAAIAGHHSGGHEEKPSHFTSLDADSSGGVSMDEFMNKHKEMFTKIDADGNGELSQEEVQAHHPKKMMKDKMNHMGDKMHDMGDKMKEKSY